MAEASDIIIGSGPSGVAAAMALLERGRNVLMLDGGKTLDDEAEARRADLAATDPATWTGPERADWMAPQFAAQDGQIRRYGSDFAIEPGTATFADLPDWMGLRSSRAAGGLSNLWGAAVLPYSRKDMADWPITDTDLAPHYRAVAEFLPVAGTVDDLEELLPLLPMAGRSGIDPAPQATELLRRFVSKRAALAATGVRAGRARQAVADGCRKCGLCLHGCPYGLIWSARDTLASLCQRPGFTYRSGSVVSRISETGNGVTLHLADGTEVSGRRVFLGAGVLETARILLASQPELGEVTLRDSQHAFLPMLHRWKNLIRPDRGRFHTLPQAFVEMDAAEVSPFLVHAQIYSWNEHFPRDLVQNYARRIPFSAPAFTALARRLIVAQLFVHSDHSHQIALRIAPDGRLLARLKANAATDAVIKTAAGHLGRAMSKVGLLPLTFAVRPGPPGSSFHVGASVPMTTQAKAGQSDTLGRPAGWQRLHLIDASSLPAIPATTITFSVMANAHRIAALAP